MHFWMIVSHILYMALYFHFYIVGKIVIGYVQQVMYENRARLLCSAEGNPTELFEHILTIADASTLSASTRHDVSEICVDNELGFAKDRTISRLEDLFRF